MDISEPLLRLKPKSAASIFGDLDAQKLRSSMTLFTQVENTNTAFREILNAFFSGEKDPLTLSIINAAIRDSSEQSAI